MGHVDMWEGGGGWARFRSWGGHGVVALGRGLTPVQSPPGTGTPGLPACHAAPQDRCHGISERHVRHPRGLTGKGQTERVSKVSWQSRARQLWLATPGAGDGGHCDVNSVTLTLAPASPSVTAVDRPRRPPTKPGAHGHGKPWHIRRWPDDAPRPSREEKGLGLRAKRHRPCSQPKGPAGPGSTPLASGSQDPPRAS